MHKLMSRVFSSLVSCALLAASPVGAAPAHRAASTVSLDVHSMLLTDVVRMIAMQTKRNIVADDSLEQLHVTLHLEGISADRALHVLTQAYGLVVVDEDGVTTITTARAMSERTAAADKNSLQTSVVRLRNASPAQVKLVLKPLLDPGTYSIDDMNNQVVFVGDSTNVRRAKAVLASIDRAAPQVRLEIKVVDISTDDRSTIGTLFGDGAGNVGQTSTAFRTTALPLSMRLNALVIKGKAKILATPRLVCLNNMTCEFLVGQEYPILTTTTQGQITQQSVEYKKIGVNLKVVANIGADGSIVAHLTPSYTGVQAATANGNPIISSRSVDAYLRIASDETVVLAGLLQDIDAETVVKVPILGDLPIFGGIFRNRDRSHHRDEIVFLITPHVL